MQGQATGYRLSRQDGHNRTDQAVPSRFMSKAWCACKLCPPAQHSLTARGNLPFLSSPGGATSNGADSALCDSVAVADQVCILHMRWQVLSCYTALLRGQSIRYRCFCTENCNECDMHAMQAAGLIKPYSLIKSIRKWTVLRIEPFSPLHKCF